MEFDLNTIFNWIAVYGYFVILPIAILEGPIITVISAFLSSQGYFNGYILFFILVLGDILGDLLYYAIGRYGKKRVLLRWGHHFGLTEKRLKKIESHFHAHSGKTLLIGKLTHSMGWAALTGAGVAEMPVGKFIFYNFIGIIPKTLFFFVIGYYAGYAYQKINSYIDQVALILFIVIIIIGVGAYIWSKRKKDIAALASDEISD
jgi:membrane protein DedA with SNARE-associated domain